MFWVLSLQHYPGGKFEHATQVEGEHDGFPHREMQTSRQEMRTYFSVFEQLDLASNIYNNRPEFQSMLCTVTPDMLFPAVPITTSAIRSSLEGGTSNSLYALHC